MDKCERIKGLIQNWKQKGDIREQDFNIIKYHIGNCTSCSREYGFLSLLMNSGVREYSAPADIESNGNTKSKPRKRTKKSVIANMAGVTFLVVVGLIFLLFGLPDLISSTELVTFSIIDFDAESVILVGDFNAWNTESHPFQRKNGVWEITIRLKKGYVYTYNFIVDGEKWITDPNSLLTVDDGFGGKSSILEL